MITGNVVESAPIVGILAGWDEFLRDVSITNNVVRKCGVGIGVSSNSRAGVTLVSGNVISGASDGAIRALEHDRPTGPDLVDGTLEAFPHIRVSGNLRT